LRVNLTARGYQVHTAPDAASGLAAACSRPGTPRRRRSPRWTPAPTTTSPNRSAWTNSWPGWAPRCAGRRPPRAAPVITTPAFTIDLSAKRVTGPAGEIRLTPTDWHLLEALTRHPDRLVTQRQLLAEV
jgi:DNA-binding response OmpR family regulator